jgi:hypothetical protein
MANTLRKDFAGLEALSEAVLRKFLRGIVLYTASLLSLSVKSIKRCP